MKYKVISPDYEDTVRPVEIWTQIEAADEQEAAEKYAERHMDCPENGEEIEIWVQSDRLYKFEVWVEIKYNIEEVK